MADHELLARAQDAIAQQIVSKAETATSGAVRDWAEAYALLAGAGAQPTPAAKSSAVGGRSINLQG